MDDAQGSTQGEAEGSASPGVNAPKRWARRVIMALGGVVLALALAFAISLTPWGRERVASLVCAIVTDQIAGALHVEEALAFDGSRLRVQRSPVHGPPRRGRDPHPRRDRSRGLARALCGGVVRLDEAEAHDAEVIIAPYDEHYSTSIEAAFGDPEGPEAPPDDDATHVLLDAIQVDDVRVRIRFTPTPTVRVASGVVRVDHRGVEAPEGARETEVDLTDVVGIAFVPDRPVLNGTPVRGGGSIYDLRVRVCHRRDELALRVIIPEESDVRLEYQGESIISRIALGFTRVLSGLSLRPGEFSTERVPRCPRG